MLALARSLVLGSLAAVSGATPTMAVAGCAHSQAPAAADAAPVHSTAAGDPTAHTSEGAGAGRQAIRVGCPGCLRGGCSTLGVLHPVSLHLLLRMLPLHVRLHARLVHQFVRQSTPPTAEEREQKCCSCADGQQLTHNAEALAPTHAAAGQPSDSGTLPEAAPAVLVSVDLEW